MEKVEDKSNINKENKPSLNKDKHVNIEASEENENKETVISHSIQKEVYGTFEKDSRIALQASQDTLKSYLSQNALQSLQRRASTSQTFDHALNHNSPKMELFRTLSLRGVRFSKSTSPVKL